MSKNDSPALDNSLPPWPTWLPESVEGLTPILDKLDQAQTTLLDTTPVEFKYRHVFNKWFNPLSHKVVDELKQGSRKTINSPPFLYAQLCKNGEFIRMVDQAIYTRSHGVQRQLAAAKNFLISGDLPNAFVMYRGVLELTAHFLGTYRIIADLDVPENSQEKNKFSDEIQRKLLPRIHGTRIDWVKLLAEDTETLLNVKSSRAISYAPSGGSVDLSSAGIMNEIDKLNKKIPKTRKVYEILCEFLHPNMGTMVGMLNFSDLHNESVSKTPFIVKTLSTSPPRGFAADSASLLVALFEQVAAVCEFFIKTREKVFTARERCQSIAQQVLRHLLSNTDHRQFAYSPCPCGSEKKLRFCCGAK